SIAIFTALIIYISVPLNRIYIFRRKTKELDDVLNEINAILNSTLKIENILREVIDKAASATSANSVHLLFRETDYWQPVFHIKSSTMIIDQVLGDELLQKTSKALPMKLIMVNDAQNDKRVDIEQVKKYGINSFIRVPLISKELAIGSIYFNFSEVNLELFEPQIDFINKLASFLLLALENARLFKSEHNIADTLQEALISMPEKMEGIDYGYRYQSASEAARVGGDFYDLFDLEDHKIGVLLGDVSGKGLEAAALTSLVKNTIRAYSLQENSSPKSVIEQTNKLVSSNSGPSTFVTLFFAILDLSLRKLDFCNAGHPPALIKRGGSNILKLGSDSPVIGIDPDLSYHQSQFSLRVGDLMVLYTDGVIEARREKEFFGEERLIELLKNIEPAGPK
ncbi:hypothetical protein LCGC14_2857500, partial [marine sediment metagenome]